MFIFVSARAANIGADAMAFRDIGPWAETEAAFDLCWTPTDPCVPMLMIFRCRCIDPDLYISCLQCMDWMFANELIVPGTVVYYDDVSIIKVRH